MRDRFVPDVIVSHFRSSHLIADSLRRGFSAAAHVAGIHQFDVRRIRTHASYRQAFGRCDVLAFRSHALRNQVLPRHPEWADKSRVASSGLSPEWLVGTAPRRGGPGARPLVIGSVCKLVAIKNLDVVLKTLAELTDRPWEYHVVGDGPERQSLEQLASQLGIEKRVRFWGRLGHVAVRARLDGWDLFVMPSAPETLGMAFLEAMARGCLVIGSRGWGIDGIVEADRNGFLVVPRDVASLSEVFRRCLAAPDETWDQWRRASRETVAGLTQKAASGLYWQQVGEAVMRHRQGCPPTPPRRNR